MLLRGEIGKRIRYDYLTLFSVIGILLVVILLLVPKQSIINADLSKKLENYDVSNESMRIYNADGHTIVTTLCNSNKEICVFYIDIENEVASVQRFKSKVDEKSPVLWSRRIIENTNSIITGVYNNEKISSLEIREINHVVISDKEYGNTSVFFSLEFYDKEPVDIIGRSPDGELIYRSIPEHLNF